MTRLELGIVSLFGAIIVMLGSAIWTMADLPSRLSREHDIRFEKAFETLQSNQTVILQKLEQR